MPSISGLLPGEFVVPALPIDLGEYIATDILARGGMGLTFLGFRKGNKQERVVIKIPACFDPQVLERFSNETQVLSKVSHPNIVKVIGSGRGRFSIPRGIRELPWLAMEYIPGQNLRERLLASGRMNWQEVYKLLQDVLEALEVLHAAGICHRDIKPDNLVYDTRTNKWKLVDFGIAKVVLRFSGLTLTQEGSDPGAWSYMSPEQRSGGTVDGRSDLFSLGVTAWEALIGETPWLTTRLPSQHLGDGSVPTDVDTFLSKLVAHSAEDRYQSATEALTALREGATYVLQREEAARKFRRRLRMASVAGMFALLLVCAFTFFNWTMNEKAEGIYLRNRNVPLKALTELESFRRKHLVWYAVRNLVGVIIGPDLAARTMNELKSKVDSVISQILDEQLPGIDRYIQSGKVDDLVRALQMLINLHQEIGPHEKIERMVRDTDDLLWKALKKEADGYFDREQFEEARERIGCYLNAFKEQQVFSARHKADAEAYIEKVNSAAEDDADWVNMRTSAVNNENQGTWIRAKADYENYLRKWPNGKHAQDAKRALEEMPQGHLIWLKKIPDRDYDGFVDEFRKFCEMWPEVKEAIAQAKLELFCRAHRTVKAIWDDERKSWGLELDKIMEMDWSACGEQYKDYLDNLANAFRRAAMSQSQRAELEFLHLWQRPPGGPYGYVKRSVYRVTLQGVWFHPSPRASEEWSDGGDGPEFYCVSRFWFGPVSCGVKYYIVDNDVLTVEVKEQDLCFDDDTGFRATFDGFNESGRKIATFDDGSQITIEWESE